MTHSFSVAWTTRAQRQMKKLDRVTGEAILRWVHKNLDGCEDPRRQGKALSANLAGKWRYRIGDYRLIADIQDDQILILILEVGHRKKVYE